MCPPPTSPLRSAAADSTTGSSVGDRYTLIERDSSALTLSDAQQGGFVAIDRAGSMLDCHCLSCHPDVLCGAVICHVQCNLSS